MPNPQLVQYFKDNVGKYTTQQLKNQLISQGHDIYEIEKALTAATGHPQRNLILWSIIIVLALIMLLGLMYLYVSPDVETPYVEQPEISEPVSLPEQESLGPIVCDDKDCAQAALTDCLPATGSYSMLFGAVVVEYEIIGPEGEYCKARAWFTANPNDGYLNKEMTCLYDPNTPLEDAIQDMSRCEGELADAILS